MVVGTKVYALYDSFLICSSACSPRARVYIFNMIVVNRFSFSNVSIFPQGMDSGFAGGEDEIYNVYDQAWRGGKDMAQSIYRPSKNLDKDMYGDDLEARIKTNRFVPDKEFSGSDRRQRGREGPVQFEEDPFGLDKFLEEAKQHGGSKRPSDSSRPKEHEHEGKKRRKE